MFGKQGGMKKAPTSTAIVGKKNGGGTTGAGNVAKTQKPKTVGAGGKKPR